MFFGKKQDTENLITKALYDDKVNELAVAHKSLSQLEAQVEHQRDTIEELHKAAKSKDEAFQTEIAKVKTQAARIQTSVTARVNDALAAVGVNQFAIETIYNSTVEATPEVIVRKFNSLPVEARHEFYNKHKDVIDKATSSDIPSVNT